jgi:serine/threonine protein kinase
MAPEMTVFGSEDPADGPKRDMWSVGVLAYFFITGDLKVDFRTQSPDFSNEVWQHVSPDAKDFIKSCLVINPENRISSGEAVKHLWLCRINWLSKQPLLDTFSQISRTASVRVFKSQLHALFFHNNESEEHKEHL